MTDVAHVTEDVTAVTAVKETAKIAMGEIEAAVDKARKESGQNVSFVTVLLFDDGVARTAQVRVDSQSDHHFCDGLTAIMETWWDCNHKKTD